ncbi:glycoside hydrolase [Cellulomonas fimi]|uniref:Glycoside hydrolase n=2 Tax=Cellulomonas fimi TaxID=1708 RepID=A0A7Y0M074_CELFI|nr:glycoside hydrolase [Cellulomonas fimi]
MSDHTTPAGATAPTGRAWWAPTMGRMTVRARIATAILAAALVVVTVVVWNSPAVSTLVGAEDAPPTAEELRLARENEELQQALWSAEGLNESMQKSQAKAQTERQAQREAQEAAEAQAAADRSAAERAATDAQAKADTSRRTSTSTKDTSSRSSGRSGSGAGAARNAAATAPVAETGPTLPSAPSKAELLSPATRYYGMYTEQAPFNWATFDDTATQVGRLPSMVGYFGGWDQGFRPDAVVRAWERGMLPLLTWESRPLTAANDQVDDPQFSLPVILAGSYDEYLRQYARDIKALGLPLAIRLNHEMNGTWYPWSEVDGKGQSINGNSLGDYVKVWQRVHAIFEQEGANDQVIWVWSPNIVNNLPSSKQSLEALAGLYPGDGFVDWVGVSGYYRPPYKDGQVPTFEYTFDRSLDQLRRLSDKPILLTEVGASEIGNSKPQWVDSFFAGLAAPENADIIGFSWFNLAVSTWAGGELLTNDWRVDSRRDSLDAFVTGIATPAARIGGLPLNSPTS